MWYDDGLNFIINCGTLADSGDFFFRCHMRFFPKSTYIGGQRPPQQGRPRTEYPRSIAVMTVEGSSYSRLQEFVKMCQIDLELKPETHTISNRYIYSFKS